MSLDEAHGATARSHHQALGLRPARTETHPAQQFAVGDAGGGEERIVAADQIVGGEHGVDVVAARQGGSALGLRACTSVRQQR